MEDTDAKHRERSILLNSIEDEFKNTKLKLPEGWYFDPQVFNRGKTAEKIKPIELNHTKVEYNAKGGNKRDVTSNVPTWSVVIRQKGKGGGRVDAEKDDWDGME